MHALRAFAVLLLAGSLLAGCGSPGATVTYAPSSDQTTYRTRSYTVSQISGANFASAKSINLRAIGRCQGQNCTPESVQLVFSASGNSSLSLTGLDGEITADGTQIDWSSAEAGQSHTASDDDQMVNVVGTFATVELSLAQLEEIATASTVQGSIGGTSLDLSSGIQSGFRSLLQKIRGSSTTDESA